MCCFLQIFYICIFHCKLIQLIVPPIDFLVWKKKSKFLRNVQKMGLVEQNADNQMKLWWNSWNRLLIGHRSLCECISASECICNRPIRKRLTNTFTQFSNSTPSFENCQKIGMKELIIFYFTTCFYDKDKQAGNKGISLYKTLKRKTSLILLWELFDYLPMRGLEKNRHKLKCPLSKTSSQLLLERRAGVS
jgi:hypothetical protein